MRLRTKPRNFPQVFCQWTHLLSAGWESGSVTRTHPPKYPLPPLSPSPSPRALFHPSYFGQFCAFWILGTLLVWRLRKVWKTKSENLQRGRGRWSCRATSRRCTENMWVTSILWFSNLLERVGNILKTFVSSLSSSDNEQTQTHLETFSWLLNILQVNLCVKEETRLFWEEGKMFSMLLHEFPHWVQHEPPAGFFTWELSFKSLQDKNTVCLQLIYLQTRENLNVKLCEYQTAGGVSPPDVRR